MDCFVVPPGLLARTCLEIGIGNLLFDKKIIMDSNDVTPNPDNDHVERVNGAFGSLEQKLGDRFSEEAERVHKIREAALKRDRAGVEKHLADTKHESNWLYEELAKHPGISAIMRELSIMGF